LRSGRGHRAATGTPTSPPWAQLPTCVHARLRRTLGSNPYPAFTGAPGPHAAYRLLQQSVPRAQLRMPQTSSLLAAANRYAPSDGVPCETLPAELSQARGRSGFFAFPTPIAATACRGGFTPT
jgi:hypothetical protein